MAHPKNFNRTLMALAYCATAFIAYLNPATSNADPTFNYAGVCFGSNNEYGHFGRVVGPAGDVNGDGFTDILVSAPEESVTDVESPGAYEGRVYVFHGKPTGSPFNSVADWVGSNGMEWSRFGYSAAPAGDVNGDGFDDLIVGAPFSDFGTLFEYQGRAYVYLGSPTGLSATPSWEVVGGDADGKFGWSVATAGDVNADGFADVLVGAPTYGGSIGGETGRARLYLGSASGLATTPSWSIGAAANSEFGYSVSSAGDTNADGFDDILVGSPGYTPGLLSPDAGRVYLYMGNASGVPTANSWTLIGPSADDRYGHCVSLAGDINGDSYADIIMGAPFYTGSTQTGRAVVCYGGPTGMSATTTTLNGTTGSEFGYSVGPAGDIDGNGRAEVMVGSPKYGTNHGRVDVYTLYTTLLDPTPAWTITGSQPYNQLGHSVGTAGDGDADGFAEILIAEPYYDVTPNKNEGRVRFYRGGTTGLADVAPFADYGNELNGRHGQRIANAGDVNGDGYEELIVASPQENGGTGSQSGVVEVFMGSAQGIQYTATPWKTVGLAAYDLWGNSVSSAGDVNGDGFDDIIIGVLGDDTFGTAAGRAYVYYGSASGLPTSPSWGSTVGLPGTEVGIAVASAGDVNGDGFGDIVLAGRRADGSADRGIVWCYLGSATGLSLFPAWSVEDNVNYQSFGHSLTSADKDGDGYSDVFIGSPRYTDTIADEGRVIGYRGSATGLESVPFWEWKGGTYTPSGSLGMRFGWSIAGIDAPSEFEDGIIIGAPYYTNGQSNEGMIYFEHNWGSAIYQSNQQNAQMGAWVCSPGDVNGDGKGDVAYGAPYWDANIADEGAYWVRLVGSTGSWVRYGAQRSAYLGTCLAGGDFNGDGFADLGIAEPWYDNNNVSNVGRVFTYLGGGNTYYKQMPYESQLKKHNGENLGRLGMSDLGTKVTLHVERAGTAAGRGLVRLEWWCRPFLDGLGHDQLSRDYTAWMPTNGPAAYGSSVPITQVISGLTPNTMYSLQWRVKSKSPYFPSTRWICMDASGRGQADFRTAPGTVSVGDEPMLTLQPMAAFPNPFSSRTQVQFDVKETGPVSLRVLDVSGRLVRTLVDETRFSGNHESSWDGVDEHGQHVAAGVYFAHLETTEGKSVQRLTLVR